MSTQLEKALGGPIVLDCISKSKTLVVGAGGIGCELLKGLVLTGFVDIEASELLNVERCAEGHLFPYFGLSVELAGY